MSKTHFEHYYAVIFTSTLSKNTEGYDKMAAQIESLAQIQSGFLGFDSARDYLGISISYWKTLEDIKKWKDNSEHLLAQQKGKEKWYDWYNVKICKVEREYSSE